MIRRSPELTVFHHVDVGTDGKPSVVLMNGILIDESRKFTGRILGWAGVNDPETKRPVPHCDVVTIEEFLIHADGYSRRRGLGSEMLRQFLKAVNDRGNLDAREVVGDIENEHMVTLLGKVAGDALTLSTDQSKKDRLTTEQAVDKLILRHAELDLLSETDANVPNFQLGIHASIQLDRLDMNSWDQASFVQSMSVRH